MQHHLPKLLIACLGAFVGAAAYWFVTSDTPQIQQPPPPTTVPKSTVSSTPVPSSRGIKVITEPSDAQIYINWMHSGATPAEFRSGELNGHIALIKEGYKAHFRETKSPVVSDISHTFEPEKTRPNNRMLLHLQPASVRHLHHLESSLRKRVVVVRGQDQSLHVRMNGTAGMSNPAIRAWVRDRHDSDFIIYAYVEENVAQFTQEVPFTDATVYVYRASVTVRMDAYNLRTGNQIATAVGSAESDLTPDPRMAVEWAIRPAADECGTDLIQRLGL